MLGVDPGTAVTGYGVVTTGAMTTAVRLVPVTGGSAGNPAHFTEPTGASARHTAQGISVDAQVRLIECGVIRTRPNEALANRLATIFDGIVELLERHRPDVIAVEGLFHGRNARSALVLGHARGVVLLAAARAGLSVAEISPAEVKRAVTGTGAATKLQVSAMVMRLLHLATSPTPADAADGVAIALTHLLRLRPRTRMMVARR